MSQPRRPATRSRSHAAGTGPYYEPVPGQTPAATADAGSRTAALRDAMESRYARRRDTLAARPVRLHPWLYAYECRQSRNSRSRARRTSRRARYRRENQAIKFSQSHDNRHAGPVAARARCTRLASVSGSAVGSFEALSDARVGGSPVGWKVRSTSVSGRGFNDAGPERHAHFERRPLPRASLSLLPGERCATRRRPAWQPTRSRAPLRAPCRHPS